MEFLLISLLLIHFTTVAMHLLSHGPHITFVMWYTVTVTCDVTICDPPSHHCDIVTKSCNTFSCALSCSCKSNKKRKRNIDNDLAVLPSHDNVTITNSKWPFVIVGHRKVLHDSHRVTEWSCHSHVTWSHKSQSWHVVKKLVVSQTSFGHISTKSSTIPTVLKPA